jgi:hypothetical protein
MSKESKDQIDSSTKKETKEEKKKETLKDDKG